MSIKLRQELNPLYETMILTYLHHYGEKMRQETVEYLENLDIDSDDFYRTHMKLLEKYQGAFDEKYVAHPEEKFFFEESDSGFVMFLLAGFFTHPDLLERKEEEMARLLLEILAEDEGMKEEEPPGGGLENYMSYISSLPLETTLKWKILSLVHEPGRWLGIFWEIYELNLPAFQYAAKKYEREIAGMLKACPEIDNPHFEKIVEEFGSPGIAYPSLILPLTEWIGGSFSFYGVLNPKLLIYQDVRDQAKEMLLNSLKLLADKSKFEILCSLKERPKYNLEIAKQLQLTPATMSHHMNLLLSGGLVTIEKTGGKVYYHFQPEKVREVLEHMHRLLL